MASTPIDLVHLIDPQELLDGGDQPWTFLAFPRSTIDEHGVPGDSEAQQYIATVQSHGIPVGIWIDTPCEGVAFAFVGPRHIRPLQQALDALRHSGRYPEGYAERLANRLLGVGEEP